MYVVRYEDAFGDDKIFFRKRENAIAFVREKAKSIFCIEEELDDFNHELDKFDKSGQDVLEDWDIITIYPLRFADDKEN